MVKIINENYNSFIQDISDKKLFLYGAGERTRRIYDTFALKGRVKAIIDKDEKKKVFRGENEKIPIITIEEFKKNEDIAKSVILIVPTYVYLEIIKELDADKMLNGLRCYIAGLVQDFYEKQDFEFTQGIPRIDKKIHYCWFGGGELPEQLKRYMDSWYKYCPDYDIIRWDESNYDVASNQYMKETYECKKWGYVPDYARLDIIYKEGGIYLDTDVELLRPIDCLLADSMFCHFACEGDVNCGAGFGAVKGHELIKKMRDCYQNKSFYNDDGSINMAPCTTYQNPVIKEYGFELKNKYQKIDDVVIYPSEVANPLGRTGIVSNFTEKTLMVHHATGTHRTVHERKQYVLGIDEIRNRIS